MQYIDVVGEADFEITAETYRFTIKLKKKSGVSQLDKNSAVQKRQAQTALENLFKALSESDIPDTGIRYGGVSDQKEWRRKKGYESYQSTAFDITHSNVNHILALQADLAELDIGKHVLEYSGFHPVYPKEKSEKIAAFAKAMENAHAIATSIAAVTEQSIGKVIHVRDTRAVDPAPYQNHYGGHVVMAAGGAAGAATPEFQEHKRTELVSLQVRFALLD